MIYSNFRIFFNPPNGLRHRPFSKRPLHSHKLVSISNQSLHSGSNLTYYIFFEIFFSEIFVFENFFSWWSNGRNGWWTSDGNWEESSWKLIFKRNTKLVRKNLFSEIKQKLIFSYQLFKKFKIIFIYVSFLDCAVGGCV